MSCADTQDEADGIHQVRFARAIWACDDDDAWHACKHLLLQGICRKDVFKRSSLIVPLMRNDRCCTVERRAQSHNQQQTIKILRPQLGVFSSLWSDLLWNCTGPASTDSLTSGAQADNARELFEGSHSNLPGDSIHLGGAPHLFRIVTYRHVGGACPTHEWWRLMPKLMRKLASGTLHKI